MQSYRSVQIPCIAWIVVLSLGCARGRATSSNAGEGIAAEFQLADDASISTWEQYDRPRRWGQGGQAGQPGQAGTTTTDSLGCGDDDGASCSTWEQYDRTRRFGAGGSSGAASSVPGGGSTVNGGTSALGGSG